MNPLVEHYLTKHIFNTLKIRLKFASIIIFSKVTPI